MLFNTYGFCFVYLPLTLAGFFLAARLSHRLALGWLGAASLAFYAWWNPPYVLLLLGSILFNYAAGRLLLVKPGRLLLALAVAADLGLLAYFKYANFFLAAAGAQPLGQIILPLGISFFTFTQIAFLVDTAQGLVAEVDFLKYLLFVTYFPHLIAGPILHHRDIMPQFGKPRVTRFSSHAMTVGLAIFSIGLLKKVICADEVAVFSTPLFDAAQQGTVPGTLAAWQAALAYSLQIYFDFSGYSDMAIGLARMIGVRLPVNFDSPYKAVSIVDFWRRWHITLSRFLRDYLYIPLGGNRHGPVRRYANLLLTMLLGGLWHGANWTFVLWGGLHGLFLLLNHAVGKFSRPLTFVAVVVAWVPFRAADLPTAGRILSAMAGFGGATAPAPAGWGWIAALLAVVWLAPNTQQICARRRQAPGWVTRHWATLAALATALGVLRFGRVSEFIYYQF